MAYFNGFPATYQPLYQVPQQTQQNGIIWIQGEAGAKSYMVAPNNTVTLWDSESQTIYLKSADATGMPSMKILDYTVRQGQNTANNAASVPADKSSTYATKQEIGRISDELAALRERVEKMEVKDE